MEIDKHVTIMMTMSREEAVQLQGALAEMYHYALQANQNWRSNPALIQQLAEQLAAVTQP